MSDTEVVENEKKVDEAPLHGGGGGGHGHDAPEEKIENYVKPHHTINQDLDIGTPNYPRYSIL